MNYIPTKADLLEMSLAHFADHAEELRQKFGQMTPEQRSAFIQICSNIAGMSERKAA
jgi:hypothetical protein